MKNDIHIRCPECHCIYFISPGLITVTGNIGTRGGYCVVYCPQCDCKLGFTVTVRRTLTVDSEPMVLEKGVEPDPSKEGKGGALKRATWALNSADYLLRNAMEDDRERLQHAAEKAEQAVRLINKALDRLRDVSEH